MPQRKPKKPANAPAVATTALALRTITRGEAQQMLKARAVELYQEARARQQEGIARFESEYGRADRIDATLLRELQHLQMRFAAIAARQIRNNYGQQEPKVNKFVKSLGEIIGDVTVHLATDNALELFAQIDEQEYLGYGHSNGTLGRKGYDPSVLENYNVVDDPKPARPNAPASTFDEDGVVCLHEDVERFDDDVTKGACLECGEEFEMPIASASEPETGAEAVA
jgi:hypothetical protein